MTFVCSTECSASSLLTWWGARRCTWGIRPTASQTRTSRTWRGGRPASRGRTLRRVGNPISWWRSKADPSAVTSSRRAWTGICALTRCAAAFDAVQVAVKDVLFEPVRKTQEATCFKAVLGPSGGTVGAPALPLWPRGTRISHICSWPRAEQEVCILLTAFVLMDGLGKVYVSSGGLFAGGVVSLAGVCLRRMHLLLCLCHLTPTPPRPQFYEPCSPGEADAFEATLSSLADQGLGKQARGAAEPL